jgi:hypothetical protein
MRRPAKKKNGISVETVQASVIPMRNWSPTREDGRSRSKVEIVATITIRNRRKSKAYHQDLAETGRESCR